MDQSQSSPQVTRSASSSQIVEATRKNPQPKKATNKEKPDSLFLIEYMNEIVKTKQAKKVYGCILCKEKPILQIKCVYRHFMKCDAHTLSITSKKHINGHDELILLILAKMEENKIKYS